MLIKIYGEKFKYKRDLDSSYIKFITNKLFEFKQNSIIQYLKKLLLVATSHQRNGEEDEHSASVEEKQQRDTHKMV